ncbi:MAG TPA: hypothetical protein VMN04_11200 [Thermoanaerobaculia bacterium]|nr:hypothetical protein [Thermoanaerobaculia bacterium]
MRVREIAAALAVLVGAAPAFAEIRRDPTGVNVSSQSPTSVYITFGGLANQTPAESLWCGELISAAPALGQRCDPNTIYGSLPVRYDRSSLNGGTYTDIMTIPATVARRAYQAAERGALSPFFYVRRFVSTVGGPDEYVFVTCRPTGGGARTPYSLTDVALAFAVDQPLLSVRQGDTVPALSAKISYTGTGRLKGRWEVVLPNDERPSTTDLLTEASLPPQSRGLQRRYMELERFNVFLPPGGRYELAGPDPKRVPTSAEGFHEILLRVEADSDRDSESNLENASAGVGVVAGGAVAGFPLPTLRYYVGSAPAALLPGATGGLALASPPNRSVLPAAEAVVFRWSPVGSVAFYRVEILGGDGALLHEAYVAAPSTSYAAPTWLASKAGDAILKWSVAARGPEGQELAASGEAELRFQK